jgi:hypothetical protein
MAARSGLTNKRILIRINPQNDFIGADSPICA